MIDLPFFPVSTPQAFYALLVASGSKDPDAMKTYACRASGNRRIRRLGEERAVDRQLRRRAVQQPQRFIFTDGSGAEHAVRWSLLPAAKPYRSRG